MRFLTNILAKAGLIVDGTTQLNTIANATIDTDKFLVSDGGVVKYRTGAEVAADIGAANLSASVLKHEVKLGEAISKGQAVYVSSADGTNMIVSKASNASEATSSKTLGLLETGGAINAKVNVITEGLLAGLDTSTAIIGDPVWLGTSGNLIFGLANKPYAPAHLVFIGIVTRVNLNNGEIFVKVQNGFELKEIHDVQITTTPSDNSVLSYELSTGLYKMKSIATLLGYTPADAARTLTINGTTYDLSANRTWNVGTVTSVGLTSATSGVTIGNTPITSSGNITLAIATAGAAQNGLLSSTDWTTFNNKQNAITLTTTGSSGAATFVSSTLNIPNYTLSGLGGVPSSRQLTINGTAYDLSLDRSWSVGTVTSVGLSAPTGFSVGSSPVTGSGTIALSFAVGYSLPTTASQSNWDTAYNNRITSLTTTGTSGAATLVSNVLNIPQYQAQGNYITSLTGEATASGPGAASVTLSTSAVTGKVLTGLNVTGGTVLATDSILTAFGKLQNQVNGLAGGVTYQGTWNASTNSPALTSSVGTKGYYYVVSVAGSTNLNGVTDWNLGDWAIFNGSTWEKVDNTDAVVSVNGFTGAVSLTTTNISEGTNLYYTDARARAAISLTTTGTSGAATYSGGVLNIPQYSLSGLGGVPTSRQLTINGTAYDLSADRTWTIVNISGNSATTSQTNFSSLTVNSNTVLHAGNYNSYAPTLTGTGASGTWSINVTGSAGSLSSNSDYFAARSTGAGSNIDTFTDNGWRILTYTGYSSQLWSVNSGGSTGTVQFELEYNTPVRGFKVRNKTDNSSWSAIGYVVMTTANQGHISGTILHSGNYNSYAPTLTGTGASGTWGISITGNAATATSASNANTLDGLDSLDFMRNYGMLNNTDQYVNFRVMRNSNSSASNDGMYIGYGNSNGGITRIFGGGATTGELIKYSNYTYEPGSFRAPIFYDSANTSYYLDPDNTGTALVVAGNVGINNISPSVKLEVNTPTAGYTGFTGTSNAARFNTLPGSGQSTALLLTQYLGDVGTDTTVDIDFAAVDSNSVLGSQPQARIGYTAVYNPLVNTSPIYEARGYFRIATRTEDTAGTLVDRLLIDHTGTLRLLNYTTNGFLKFSNSDGTVTVDTNTYLTAETDTLASVTGRGATTSTALTLNGTVTFTSSYSGGSGDWTAITNPSFKVAPISGYWRIPHLSNNATVSGVYNYETGKDVYWGEPSDGGNYYFRGRVLKHENSLGQISIYLHSNNYNSYAPTLTGGGASGTWGISISGNSATTSQTNFSSLTVNSNTVLHAGNYTTYAASSANFKHLGTGVNYDVDRTMKTSGGLAVYSGYSTGTNRPTTYDVSAQFSVDGNRGFEIAADWISTSSTPLRVRSLRDCCQNWSSWSVIATSNESFTNNVDLRAPRFYDSDNTGYYLDPASTSNLNKVATTGLYGPGGSGNIAIWQYDSGNPGYGIMYYESSPDYLKIDVSGNLVTGTPDFQVSPDAAYVNGVQVVTNSGTWGINVTGTAGSLSNMNISQFTNNSGYITSTSSDFTYNASLTLSTSWQDTGVSASNLTTSGVYIVTCSLNDFSVGGGQYSETYVGTMYWYAGSTNSTNYAEISLHHSGHADNDRYIYLRTRTDVGASTAKIYLQIKGNGNNSGTSTYTFTFKRLL